MSSNGLLSTVSVVTAAVLVAAAIKGARTVSTVMLVFGVLFLLSAFANLAVLETSANILAFSMSNGVPREYGGRPSTVSLPFRRRVVVAGVVAADWS